MNRAQNGDVTIHYEDLGDPAGQVLVLLAGAGRPSSDFDPLFCAPLLEQGYRLILVDARDTGFSSHFTGRPANLRAVRNGAAPLYGLPEMAADLLAVLDHARIDTAHLIGRSLGGQVAQLLALQAPERVAGLVLIMAASRSVAAAVPDAVLDRLESESVTGEADYIERQLRTVAANGLPQDQDIARVTEEAQRAWARGIPAGGTARHFAAGLAMADLRGDLARLAMPVLILQGLADKVIPPGFAQETAAAIPGAVLELWPDMAHDGPPRLRRAWALRIRDWLGKV